MVITTRETNRVSAHPCCSRLYVITYPLLAIQFSAFSDPVSLLKAIQCFPLMAIQLQRYTMNYEIIQLFTWIMVTQLLLITNRLYGYTSANVQRPISSYDTTLFTNSLLSTRRSFVLCYSLHKMMSHHTTS